MLVVVSTGDDGSEVDQTASCRGVVRLTVIDDEGRADSVDATVRINGTSPPPSI